MAVTCEWMRGQTGSSCPANLDISACDGSRTLLVAETSCGCFRKSLLEIVVFLPEMKRAPSWVGFH
jgi:hypothetical protein